MKRQSDSATDGFEAWGGYMNAKKSKLEDQYAAEAANLPEHRRHSQLFKGVSIFVNGFSEPPAEVLRRIMMQHGGTFHDYQVASTTHVVASNLPNAKLEKKGSQAVVRPEWIVESLAAGRLLPLSAYLLTARAPTQPKINFHASERASKTANDAEFISEFYSNSRLHHLSTMGALLKQYVSQMKENHDGVYPGRDRLKAQQQQQATQDPPVTLNEKVIMHIDMDCFFVSVAIRDRAELKGRPVAVTHAKGNPTHMRAGADPAAERAIYAARAGLQGGRFEEKAAPSDSGQQQPQSMADVACCSYEARAMGVRNGMYVGKALALCPGLVTVPYDFPSYTHVSYALYDVVAEYTLDVEAVSCDELFVDCTGLLRDANISADVFVKTLRDEVTARTRCPCSAGLGPNKLLARLASKKAKPNGQYHVLECEGEAFMRDVRVSDLPGVGWSTAAKLAKMDVETCLDLQQLPLPTIKAQLGEKTGKTLFRHCRGIDERTLVTEYKRKSVSCEINFGIRFTSEPEAEDFLKRLSCQVAERLTSLSLRGRCVSLKLMVRSADAPVETAKYLGHGVCDAASRSASLPAATAEAAVLTPVVLKLYQQMGFPANELRGVGIQVTKLDSKPLKGSLMSFLARQSNPAQGKAANVSEEYKKEMSRLEKEKPAHCQTGTSQIEKPSVSCLKKASQVAPAGTGQQTLDQAFLKMKPLTTFAALPLISELDPEVLKALPEDIRREVLAEYSSSGPQVFCDESSSDSCASTKKGGQEGPGPDVHDASSMDSTSCQNERSMFSGLAVTELRDIVETWVESESSPGRYDIEMLGKHLATLASERQLEHLDVVLTCLWRCVSTGRIECKPWVAAYHELLDFVQQAVLTTYGAPLKVRQL